MWCLRFFLACLVAYTFSLCLQGCTHQTPSSDSSASSQPDLTSNTEPTNTAGVTITPIDLPDFPASDYLLASGGGDLKRGTSICLRTSDLAARAELAKLIRVRVKERSTDRIRERTNRSIEQDIEVLREEQADQMLQEVRIVHRAVDKTSGTCTSIAAMPKRLGSTPPSPTGSSREKPVKEPDSSAAPPASPH